MSIVESTSQRVSLVGQVVEDLSFDPLGGQRFTAALKGLTKQAYYKDNGYFAFTNLAPGDYTLVLSGERLKTQEIPVTIPAAPIVFDPNKSKLTQLLDHVTLDQPGSNELSVIVKSVNGANNRISFDQAIVPRPINVGAPVLTETVTTALSVRLDPGPATSARLDSLAGINAGDIVRIVRDRSIRMRFDPYATASFKITRIVGTVTVKDHPEAFLQNALVSVTEVNNGAVTVTDVGGANILTAVIDGSPVIVGVDSDLKTIANHNGDYAIYFSNPDITSVTLSAQLAGFQTSTTTIVVTPLTRVRADFQLTKN